MRAHPILLQKKYARIIELFAKEMNISLDEALGIFYILQSNHLPNSHRSYNACPKFLLSLIDILQNDN